MWEAAGAMERVMGIMVAEECLLHLKFPKFKLQISGPKQTSLVVDSARGQQFFPRRLISSYI